MTDVRGGEKSLTIRFTPEYDGRTDGRTQVSYQYRALRVIRIVAE